MKYTELNVYLIEDDLNLGQSLVDYLKTFLINVTWYKNLTDAEEILKLITKGTTRAILLLDWMLPDGEGLDFLKSVRKINQNIPIIMLTARNELVDRVVGLESGANDYLTKPFDPRELIARIRVQIRIFESDKGEIVENRPNNFIEVELLKISLETREVFYNNKKIELTKMEYDLLRLLSEHPNRVFSREEILNKVWGLENYPTTRTVDTHIMQLRQKTADHLFETVRGIGYRILNA
ncbi:MAG: response regulator transcription factor [Oligoflexia bacterium]|nr:response regulator transcription factor [Oligoflexia bacterium]MBF0365029.1 response regulator transcription factor [Oligoflexia bacterium]